MTHDYIHGDMNIPSVAGRPRGAKNRPKPLYEGDGEVAGARLRQFVERIERRDAERLEAVEDIKEIYGELYGEGYDKKAIRQIIKMRGADQDKLREEEAILATYLRAMDMA